jgi:hypothetical protein
MLSNTQIVILVFIALIDLTLKGFALYKAARLGEKAWFVILLALNTAGILPAIYLLIKKDRKI